jgi:hypothetical protein
MCAVYQKILDRIEREDFPVLQKRISLSRCEKATSTLGAFFQGILKIMAIAAVPA